LDGVPGTFMQRADQGSSRNSFGSSETDICAIVAADYNIKHNRKNTISFALFISLFLNLQFSTEPG
jgi:hypothetical protein